MKAASLKKRGSFRDLEVVELPKPECGPNEVLVRVVASAVTPSELDWYPTFTSKDGQPRPFPVVLGHEFSGVIEKVGSEVADLKAKNAIYGMNDWFINGAQAEYCVASAEAVAPKPNSLDHRQAAVVPISALTAWQGLFERGHLERGQTVLVHGGAGAVGIFAVQLARWRGARVIATGSARNLDFMRQLGADEVIDYRASRFEDVAGKVDLAFDTVGGETLARSWAILKPGGKVVTIAAGSSDATDQRVRDAFFIVTPQRAQLVEVARMIDDGTLKVFVEGAWPLEQVVKAYEKAAAGGIRGKVVLEMSPS